MNIVLIIVYMFGVVLLGERPSSNEYLILSFQVVIFLLIAYNHLKKNDLKKLKDDVFLQSSLKIYERETFVKISHWVLLFFIYLSLDLISDYVGTLIYIMSQCLTFALSFLVIYPLIIESNTGFKKSGVKKVFGFAIMAYLVTYGFDIIYSLIIEYLNMVPDAGFISENQIVVEKMIRLNPMRQLFSTAISAAIMEELVFRGLGFRTLLHRNKPFAYTFTFLLFGFIHLGVGFISGNGLCELVFLPMYGFSGFALAYVYERTECIYTSMLTHFINNLISFIMIVSF